MPFDFKKFDEKCNGLNPEELQREWQHYTRLITGAATSTTVSGLALPLTAGVSTIGIALAAPAIHNARKKREIIEKHLNRHNTTHNTRKRDVLGGVAVSGTIGVVTLGVGTLGADALAAHGAEHGISAIVENELAIKVVSHAALDGAGIGVEHLHTNHLKKRDAKKAFQAAGVFDAVNNAKAAEAGYAAAQYDPQAYANGTASGSGYYTNAPPAYTTDMTQQAPQAAYAAVDSNGYYIDTKPPIPDYSQPQPAFTTGQGSDATGAQPVPLFQSQQPPPPYMPPTLAPGQAAVVGDGFDMKKLEDALPAPAGAPPSVMARQLEPRATPSTQEPQYTTQSATTNQQFYTAPADFGLPPGSIAELPVELPDEPKTTAPIPATAAPAPQRSASNFEVGPIPTTYSPAPTAVSAVSVVGPIPPPTPLPATSETATPLDPMYSPTPAPSASFAPPQEPPQPQQQNAAYPYQPAMGTVTGYHSESSPQVSGFPTQNAGYSQATQPIPISYAAQSAVAASQAAYTAPTPSIPSHALVPYPVPTTSLPSRTVTPLRAPVVTPTPQQTYQPTPVTPAPATQPYAAPVGNDPPQQTTSGAIPQAVNAIPAYNPQQHTGQFGQTVAHAGTLQRTHTEPAPSASEEEAARRASIAISPYPGYNLQQTWQPFNAHGLAQPVAEYNTPPLGPPPVQPQAAQNAPYGQSYKPLEQQYAATPAPQTYGQRNSISQPYAYPPTPQSLPMSPQMTQQYASTSYFPPAAGALPLSPPASIHSPSVGYSSPPQMKQQEWGAMPGQQQGQYYTGAGGQMPLTPMATPGMQYQQ